MKARRAERITSDKARFAHATDEINRSGAELTLMLGDMVHFKDDLDAYTSMQELVKRFDKPYHYVRGNHEVPELFMKYYILSKVECLLGMSYPYSYQAGLAASLPWRNRTVTRQKESGDLHNFMSRIITIAAAQSGPVSRQETRSIVVERLIAQLREASVSGCDLIVFTECALTAFFPHWFMEDPNEIDSYFERDMPNSAVQPLFDEAKRLKIGFHLGYAELAIEDGQSRHYNSSVLVGKNAEIIGHYRKIHLPGHTDHRPNNPFQNLEKCYFDVGNLGFRTWRAFGGVVGLCICNDRRWSETYRVLALRGAELILLGYNTPSHNPEHPDLNHLNNFHNRLSMQAGAYQNGCWVVGVAKAGVEEGVDQIGQSAIIAPSGEVVAATSTLADEIVIHCCDLDHTQVYKNAIFNFENNRRTEHYGPITEQTKAVFRDDVENSQ